MLPPHVASCVWCVRACVLLQGLDSEEQGYVLADQNFTVHYQIFNVGDAAAFGLSFKDNWPEDSFDVIEGQFEGEFESLDA